MVNIPSIIVNTSEILFKFLGIVSIVIIFYGYTIPEGSKRQSFLNIGFILMIVPRIFEFLGYIGNKKISFVSKPGYGLRNDIHHTMVAFRDTRGSTF